MQPWELAAREAIRQTLADYNQFGDHGDLDGLASVFTQDGVLEIAGRARHEGRDAIRAMGGDVQADLRAAEPDGAPVYLRHHVSSLQFESVTPDEARTRCYFLAITQRGVDHWGGYRDRLVRESDGAWRIAHRKVRVDGHSEHSAMG